MLLALRAFFDLMELVSPQPFEHAGPFVQRPEFCRVGAIQHLFAIPPRAHEPHVAQNTQMFRYRRLREFERIDELAHRSLVAGDEFENGTTLRFSDCIEYVRTRRRARHVRIIFLCGNMSRAKGGWHLCGKGGWHFSRKGGWHLL